MNHTQETVFVVMAYEADRGGEHSEWQWIKNIYSDRDKALEVAEMLSENEGDEYVSFKVIEQELL